LEGFGVVVIDQAGARQDKARQDKTRQGKTRQELGIVTKVVVLVTRQENE
jgi:hypothetical protein